ncbi:MAG: hypothetical protein KatS3mg109_0979 [Pirellulaceae bacterium]|nr:MAG: hypothetical protein KatS3mg109_0979 [Pirellulaceae bacterium]
MGCGFLDVRFSIVFWLPVSVTLLGAGCAGQNKPATEEPQGYWIRFRLLEGGKPLRLPMTARIPGLESVGVLHVGLVPVQSEGHILGEYVGSYGEDGSVKVFFPEQCAVPGLYKVVIRRTTAMPGDGDPFDPYSGRYTAVNTPLRLEVARLPPLGETLDLGIIDLASVAASTDDGPTKGPGQPPSQLHALQK